MKRFNIYVRIKESISTAAVSFIFFIFTLFISCSAQNSSRPAISDNIFNNTMVRMTWQEIKAAAEKEAIVLVPISIVEEHGPHMDLSIDILITSHICSKIKEILEKDSIPTVIAPPYYWGISLSTNFLPGTFNIKESTMKLVLTEMVENMVKWGFKRFYFMNLHGDPGQILAVSNIVSSINSSGIAKVYDVKELPAPPNPPAIPSETPGMFWPDFHAGANETKTVWSIEPSIVRTDIASTLKPQKTFTPLGYLGDPANFMASNSDQIFFASEGLIAKKIENHILLNANVKK